jgi:hypothetical protein
VPEEVGASFTKLGMLSELLVVTNVTKMLQQGCSTFRPPCIPDEVGPSNQSAFPRIAPWLRSTHTTPSLMRTGMGDDSMPMHPPSALQVHPTIQSRCACSHVSPCPCKRLPRRCIRVPMDPATPQLTCMAALRVLSDEYKVHATTWHAPARFMHLRFELLTGKSQPSEEEMAGYTGTSAAAGGGKGAKGVPFFWLNVLLGHVSAREGGRRKKR